MQMSKNNMSHLMCRTDSMGVVPPPNTQTVKKTTSSVVVNIICRAYVAVSRIANANAIAPRRPAERHVKKTNVYQPIILEDGG